MIWENEIKYVLNSRLAFSKYECTIFYYDIYFNYISIDYSIGIAICVILLGDFNIGIALSSIPNAFF